jgi:hypothetical protein
MMSVSNVIQFYLNYRNTSIIRIPQLFEQVWYNEGKTQFFEFCVAFAHVHSEVLVQLKFECCQKL